jgi:hypothetical protein
MKNETKFAIVIVITCAVVWALGFVTGAITHLGDHRAIVTVEQPSCPTEDSCYADYDGATHTWSIHEGER